MNVILVHGSNSSEKEAKKGKAENERHWKPWLKAQLESHGIKVSNELYPKDWNPDYLEWKKLFEKNIINKESILIGHSAGGGFLVRWLGETKRKIKKLILVAPAIIASSEWISLNNFLNFDINPNMKDFVDEGIIFVSDDDSKGIKKSVNIFAKALEVKPIELKNKGHFTDIAEFPELLAQILKE